MVISNTPFKLDRWCEGSNRSLSTLVKNFFLIYIRNIRATNGKKRGSVKYWLPSHIKALYFNDNLKAGAKREQCLFTIIEDALDHYKATGINRYSINLFNIHPCRIVG